MDAVLGSEGLDSIGVEAAPVGTVRGNNDGGLKMSQRLDLIQRLGVLSHIDDLVLSSLGIERPVRSIALDT